MGFSKIYQRNVPGSRMEEQDLNPRLPEGREQLSDESSRAAHA